ncbi:hypothetical protein [Moraxella lacunata]
MIPVSIILHASGEILGDVVLIEGIHGFPFILAVYFKINNAH